MRRSLFLLLFISSFAFANKRTTSSKLKDVTVYLNGAQITRTTSIQLQSGSTEFILDGLSPNIQENSIQVSGLQNASILSINYGINFLTKKQHTIEIESLKERIKVLNDKIQYEDHLIHGYNEEMYVIQNNRVLGNQNQVVNLEKLKQFASYYRHRMTEIKSSIYTSVKKKQEINKEITDVNNQLREYNAQEKLQTGEIKLKLNSSTSTNLNLIISYNVTNAGWFPIYDLKADNINSPLQLTYKAHVYQNTGLDWNDVKIRLSTSNPNTNNIKPEVNPKYLNFVNANYYGRRASKRHNYNYNPTVRTVSGVVTSSVDGLPLPGVNIIEKGTSNGVQTDFEGKYTIRIQGGNHLVYSFISMMSEELPIHSSVMNISLEDDIAALDELVVTGYRSKVSGMTNSVQNMIDQDLDDEPYVEFKNYTSNGNVIEDGITNISFEISKTYDISSNEDVTVIEIDKYALPATYSYFAAPILNENVFLTAKIENFEQYNLLPAEANVYFEGSYSGKTHINPQTSNNEMTISLGVDQNVVVKRTQPKDFKKNTFIGNNKIIAKHYEIELKNNKASAIDLVLYDRIPISQNKEIKVDDVETGTSEYDNKKGLLKWTLSLPSNVKKTYEFSYALKYPKNKRINL
ncbi:mucoidy inhibitor MuiA family protein [Psychroserpens sp.]|uniref:mucoidy inhibitor MuiA family protein n=1 Tax=Psychroserpens sp. TaxID=2020870 RepID=UPI003859FFF6